MNASKDYITVFYLLLLVFTKADTSAFHALWPRNVKIFDNGRFNFDIFGTHQNLNKPTSVSKVAPSKSGNSNVTYMEKVPDYPEKMVKELLMKEGDQHKDFFGAEPVWKEDKPMSRAGGGDKELCPALIQTVYPKQAENKDGKWRYVVNVADDYTQGVVVETCRHNDKCDFQQAFPTNYKPVCEQRYVYKRLLAITDTGTSVVDEFKMPSCCMCVLKTV